MAVRQLRPSSGGTGDGTGGTGADGRSAYQVWLDAGNAGTVAQYLASLKGAPGTTPTVDAGPVSTGDPGTSAAVTPGGTPTARTFAFTIPRGNLGPQGPQGLKGDLGGIGPQGPQGLKGDTGNIGPQGPQGLKGDTGNAGGTGPQGLKGDTGTAGRAMLSGTTVPTTGTGQDGDLYVRTDTAQLYGPKTSSGWGTPTLLRGIRVGTVVPTTGTYPGVEGDVYIDRDAGNVYYHGTSGWGPATSLKGTPGVNGTSIIPRGDWSSSTPTENPADGIGAYGFGDLVRYTPVAPHADAGRQGVYYHNGDTSNANALPSDLAGPWRLLVQAPPVPSGGASLSSQPGAYGTRTGAVGSSTDAARGDHAHPQHAFTGYRPASGFYYYPAGGNITNASVTLNELKLMRITMLEPFTPATLGVYVATVGASSNFLHALYAADGTAGRPGTLVASATSSGATTSAGAAAGTSESTSVTVPAGVTYPLPAGDYWIGSAVTGATGAIPTGLTSATQYVPHTAPPLNSTQTATSITATGGVAPTTATAVGISTTAAVRTSLKVA